MFFLQYQLMCRYNLSETARGRLLVRISSNYGHLEVCYRFLFEQEPFFAYKSREFIPDRDTGLWVVAYYERVVRVCARLLMAAYGEQRFWYVPQDVIAFALELSMAMETALRSRANVRGVLELVEII